MRIGNSADNKFVVIHIDAPEMNFRPDNDRKQYKEKQCNPLKMCDLKPDDDTNKKDDKRPAPTNNAA